MIRKRHPVRPALGQEDKYHAGVGARLKHLREELGMGRTEFAEAVGVSRWSIILYEDHGRPTPLAVATRAASLAGIKIADLVGK